MIRQITKQKTEVKSLCFCYNSNMFYFDDVSGQKVLKSTLLKEVNAFFTLRNTNLQDIFDSYKLSNAADRFIKPEQTHSNNVRIVNSAEEYPQTDGLIICEEKILVYLKFADCTPLIFYDSSNHIGAVTHAGWRGTAERISVKTIEKMKSDFGTKPEDVKVLIGPAIGMCCYEVSDEVKNKLTSAVSDKAALSKGNYVDLKQINARQLYETGVRSIDICPYCTSCNNDMFYSYRKENGTDNRHYAVLVL